VTRVPRVPRVRQRPLWPEDSRYPTHARRHGLSHEQIENLLRVQQAGKCASCHDQLADTGIRADVDHDHVLAERHGHDPTVGCSLCVNAILCRPCNSMLAFARDNPEHLRAGAIYLEKVQARRAKQIGGRP
jgi:hypothetical protein